MALTFSLKSLADSFNTYNDDYDFVEVPDKLFHTIRRTLLELIKLHGCTIKSKFARENAEGIGICAELGLITSYSFPKRMHEHEPGATYAVDEHSLYLENYAGYWMLTQRGEDCLEEIIEIYGHPYSAYEIGTVAPDAEGLLNFKIRRDNLRELFNEQNPTEVHTKARETIQNFFDNKVGGQVIEHDFRGRKD